MAKVSTTRPSVRYIDQDLVLSDSEAWTYLRLSVHPYEFRSEEERVSIVNGGTLGLAGLVAGLATVDCHLIVTHRPVNVGAWADALDERVQRWGHAPGWEPFLAKQFDYMNGEQFFRKEVYLGVCLGRRGQTAEGPLNVFAETMGSALKVFTKTSTKVEKAAGLIDDVVDHDELEMWRRKAKDIQVRLARSRFRAVPASPQSVAWLVTKPLWPDMFCPAPSVARSRVWGPGELEMLGEGFITNGRRYLRVDQVDDEGIERTGYVAALSFSRFPDKLLFPDQEPWVHKAAALAFPVDVVSRFTIVPTTKVRTEVSRKLLEAKDQGAHTALATGGVPLAIQEALAQAETLEYVLTKDNTPFAYGRHQVLVSALDEELLLGRCRAVIDTYRDLGIDVTHSTGDQLAAVLQAMPGDKVRLKSYYQRHSLDLISGGMPTASAEIGDVVSEGKGWIGPFLGETTSRARTPVHFCAHVAPSRNFPPGVAITGAPGGGKSFLAFTIAYQAAMYGAWVVVIDPKADAKPIANLQGLGKSRVFDLREGNAGMLDPFSLAGGAESRLLAIETLRLLLGSHLSEDREEAIANSIERVAQTPNPSLGAVVQDLLASSALPARAAGQVLSMISQLPFAKLCFDVAGRDQVRPEDGLTVITLLGLDLPDASTAPESYSYPNRLAVAVMYLLTRYTHRLMLHADKNHPKMIIIDEAWAIASTQQGAKLIPELARMGRSHNTVPVLVSQNAGDLAKEEITNSISTVFSFRSTSRGEVEHVMTLLGMDPTPSNAATIRELANGECVMRDPDGRLQTVLISRYDQDMFDAFNTNPETRGKAEAARLVNEEAARAQDAQETTTESLAAVGS